MKLSTTLIAAGLGTALLLVANLDQAQAGNKKGGNKGGLSFKLGNNKPQLNLGNNNFQIQNSPLKKLQNSPLKKIQNYPLQKVQSYPSKKIQSKHFDCHYGFCFKPSYTTHYCNPYVVVPVHGVVVETIAIDPRAHGESPQGLAFLAAARHAFLAHDFRSALSNVEHALIEMPSNPNAHQLKSLTLFAIGKFRESAGSAHVAMTAGRVWNWPTLRSFYISGNEYAAQLHRLEIAVKMNPSDAASRFLLGYHYMMLGHTPQAVVQLQTVVQLEPRDQMAAQMLKMAGPNAGPGIPQNVGQPMPGQLAAQPQPIQQNIQNGLPANLQNGQPNGEAIDPAAINAPTGPATPIESAPAPGQLGAVEGNIEAPKQNQPVGPAAIAQIGTFKASPVEGVAIQVELRPDGTFTWKVDAKGQKKEFSGKFTIENNNLTLARENDAQKMVGKLTPIDQNSFNFKLENGKEKDTGLNFARI